MYRTASSQKTSKKRIFLLKLSVMIGASVVIISSLISVVRLRIKQENRVQQLRQEVLSLEESNQELRDEINYRQSLEFIEKEAREKLKMTKEGEKIVIVPPKPTPTREDSPEQEPQSLLEKIWFKISNVFKKN